MIQSLLTLAHCPREKGEGRREEERRKGGEREEGGKRRGGREEGERGRMRGGRGHSNPCFKLTVLLTLTFTRIFSGFTSLWKMPFLCMW